MTAPSGAILAAISPSPTYPAPFPFRLAAMKSRYQW